MSYQELPIRSETYSDYSYQPLVQLQSTGGDRVADFTLRHSVNAIEKLRVLETNWDGRGSIKPTQETVDVARLWLTRLHASLSEVNAIWTRPHVTASEDGAVVLEWWRAQKKLTLYLSYESAEFIKVWGSHIKDEMLDGDLSPADFPALWKWLLEH